MSNIVPTLIYKGYKLIPISDANKDSYFELKQKLAEEANEVNTQLHIDHVVWMVERYTTKENRGYLITKQGEVVGDLFILSLSKAAVAHVTSINLLTAHRGKGLGTGLMGLVKTCAEDSGCNSISLTVMSDNSRVLNFYKNLGYTIRHSSEDSWLLQLDLVQRNIRYTSNSRSRWVGRRFSY